MPARCRTDGPNVVLVVLDTARADALEPYGAATGASPVLADLARAGTTVLRAYSTANWTYPAHISLLTGLLHRDLDLVDPLSGEDAIARNSDRVAATASRSLAAVLGGAGWHTRGASANPWVTPGTGFEGFDDFAVVAGTRRHQHTPSHATTGIRSALRNARLAAERAADAVRCDTDDGAAELEQIAARWIYEVQPGRPFFWFFNVLECHSPYQPPRSFAQLGPLGRIRLAGDHARYGSVEQIGRINCGMDEIPPDAVARMRAGYRGGVLAADAWLGRLLERLDAAGLLDDTVVIVTSDHGENLGESGRIGHAYWLDDRLVHVPLVVRGPVTWDATATTSLVSVPRLLAGSLGLTDHPWDDDPSRDGLAFAHHQRLVAADDARLRALVADGTADAYAAWRMSTATTAVTDGRLKLVREGSEDWLYVLADDPLELAPLRVDGHVVAEHGSDLARLRDAADRHDWAAAPAFTAPRVSRPRAALSDDVADRMRLLGYL
ncbi:MAG TPA: sulfatase-like hydrolase/transferase [Mycobacteriales bacterium]|nr:sulfatase-like hydrolase/transferase [Mycobacteriales bacterium]